jgi:hypothetical protein
MMGRQRINPVPRFLTVVADTAAEAEDRNQELHQLAKPTGGRPVRVDRLREAMAIADQVPPTFRTGQRMKRGITRSAHIPRRERRAVAMLRDVCAARGDHLTEHNATRIIEQARVLIDRKRGISPGHRQAIEEAREVVEHNCFISPRDRLTVIRAYKCLGRAPTISPWDRELLGSARRLLAGTTVR